MYIEITPTNNIVTFRYQTTPDYDSEVIDFTQLKQDLVVTLKYENGAWIASHNYNQIATAIAEGVLVRLTDETNSRYAIMGEYGDDFYSFVTNDGETCYFYKVTDADMWSLSTSPAINVADNLTTNDPDKALSAKQGVVLKGMLDQITVEGTDNVADMNAALTGKDGLTAGNDGSFYGIAGTGGWRGNTIPVGCEAGEQYTLSFKAYTDGNQGTSGNGLRVVIVYTDDSTTIASLPNSTSAYTLFSKTSTAGKTVSHIEFGYVTNANNIWYVKELQLRKGTEVLAYLPPKSVVDFVARAGLTAKEDVANKATVLSPVPNNTRYPSEKMMYDSAIVPFRDITMPKSSNIYDYATVGVINGYIVRTTGAIGTNEEYAAFTTGLIPVKPNHYYYLSNNYGTKGIRCLKADSTTKLKVLAPSNGAEYSDWYLPNADATDSVQNGQFKTPADAAYVQITVTPLHTSEIGDYYKIMLEDVGDAYDPSFVPSEYAPYSTERAVRNDCLEIPVDPDAGVKKELKILCVGNSFTLDSMGYVPFLLKNIDANCKLTIGVAFISGSPLAQHLAYFSGESIVQGTTTYYTEDGAYKKNANGTISTVTYTYYKNVNGAPWTTQNNAQIGDFINDEAWDVVTFQQASAQSYRDWATYFKPFIYKLHKSLADVLDNPNFRIGWLLTHGASGGSDQGYYDRWLGTARNAQRVMENTGASVLFPYGTAVQNLRTTSLISLGDGEHHNLTVDDAHLQDGIGCLCAAYANTLVLLRLFSEDTKGIIGNTIRPDAAWLTANNVPGTSLGQSGVIGITDANCFLAQMAAIKGVMAPYEVTDINVYEAISATYVTFDIEGYTLSGIAGTATDPGAPAGKVFWLAFDAGTYANFGSTVIAAGQVGIFSYDGSSWTYTVKTIADLSNYATLNQLNAKYTKPENGIPASDLAEGVIPDTSDFAKQDGIYPDMVAGVAKALTGPTISDGFIYRKVGNGKSDNGLAIIDKIRGKSLVWNQLMTNNANTGTTAGITYTNNGDGSITIVADGTRTSAFSINPNGSYTVSLINGHKYLLRGCPAGGNVQTYSLRYNSNGFGETGDGAILVCDGTATSGKISISPLIIIQAGVSGTFTFRPMLIDITLLFGSGYEPATVEEFEALYPLPYYAYNAGQIISNKTEAIEVVGFNQWDEEWELGRYNDDTGEKQANANMVRSTNRISLCNSTTYYIQCAESSGIYVYLYFYDAGDRYLGRIAGVQFNVEITPLPGAASMAFFLYKNGGITTMPKACINISSSRNGEYEPYHKTTVPLNIPTITGKLNGEGESVVVFPQGMRSAGSVYDEIVGNKAIVRLAEVDLGDLTWGKAMTTGGHWRFSASRSNIVSASTASTVPNMVCTKYDAIHPNNSYTGITGISNNVGTHTIFVCDESYTDAVTFKAAMAGVKLIYELATPLEYVLDEPVTPKTYQVDKDGTERRLPADTASVVNAPFVAEITYPRTTPDKAYGLPYGAVVSGSTATALNATVDNFPSTLTDGVMAYIRNDIVNSASGFTLNVNGTGAKPVYASNADATRITTQFSAATTYLFVYNSTRVSGGCWDMYYGYDSNSDTVAYQIRTNGTITPVSDTTYLYRLLFTSHDWQTIVPATTSGAGNATAAREVNQRKIDPFGPIWYYNATTTVNAGTSITVSYLWMQYSGISLGYSFNRTGAALTLTPKAPVFIKCAPQADGSAIIDADTPYVQALPSTDDGKIYIFLGYADSATAVTLYYWHPVYCVKGGAVRKWTGVSIDDTPTQGSNNQITSGGVYAMIKALADANGLTMP